MRAHTEGGDLSLCLHGKSVTTAFGHLGVAQVEHGPVERGDTVLTGADDSQSAEGRTRPSRGVDPASACARDLDVLHASATAVQAHTVAPGPGEGTVAEERGGPRNDLDARSRGAVHSDTVELGGGVLGDVDPGRLRTVHGQVAERGGGPTRGTHPFVPGFVNVTGAENPACLVLDGDTDTAAPGDADPVQTRIGTRA